MTTSGRSVTMAVIIWIALMQPALCAQDPPADIRARAEEFLASFAPAECAIAGREFTERAGVFVLSGWGLPEVGRVIVDRESGAIARYVAQRPPQAIGPVACDWSQIADVALQVAAWAGSEVDPGWELGVQWADARKPDGAIDLLVGGVRGQGSFTLHQPSPLLRLSVASDTCDLLSMTTLIERSVPQRPPPGAMQAAEQAIRDATGGELHDLAFGPMQWLGESETDGVWFATVVPAPGGPAGLSAAQVSIGPEGKISVEAAPLPPGDQNEALAALRLLAFTDQAAWAELALKHHHRVEDTSPAWTVGGAALAFSTIRRTAGVAPWARREAVALCSLGDGTPQCIMPAWDREPACLSVAGRTLLQTTTDGDVRVAALTTGNSFGAWERVSDADCNQSALSPSTNHIAYSADRRHGDRDIFIDMIDWDAECLADHRRIVRIDGADEHPVFSPDGEWVYYAHAEEGSWSLRRARSDAPHNNTDTELVLGGFERVGRMSFFPDGRRLLVWHEGGFDVVDVEGRTKEPLGLPELHDPDLPDGPPLKVQDPAVSPDGTRLAFSGYRDAEGADGLSGWYIYTCGLDGSNLERITPLEDEPIDFYVFPETGVSAFDLEKQMILERERE